MAIPDPDVLEQLADRLTALCANMRDDTLDAVEATIRRRAVERGPTFVEFAARQADGSFGPYRAIGVDVAQAGDHSAIAVVERTAVGGFFVHSIDTSRRCAIGINRRCTNFQKAREAAGDGYRPEPLGPRPAIFKGRPEG